MTTRNYVNNKKIKIIMILVLTIVLIVGILSLAWFYNKRGLVSYTHVAAPSTLAIKGYNETTVEEIKLSTVDLTNKEHKASFVFCITGKESSNYNLELAYTTNVPFKYTVRKTSQSIEAPSSGSALQYVDDTGTYYYGTGEEALSNGSYINAVDSNGDLAIKDSSNDKDRHQSAYDEYLRKNVQKHAEPVYYLFENLPVRNQTNNKFVDYYILELTWTDEVAAKYRKETDLVYLLASN